MTTGTRVGSMPKYRMLFVHAHPDDETISTGGAIAHYRRHGVDVTVLTCTLGEEGEIIGERWAGLAAGAGDQLGGYRILELTRALARLGVGEPRFLGGAGRWRDSGMAGAPSAENPRAFVNADPDDVVAELVAVIDELRPHVVVTYDAHGGYGHPDHIQAHRITGAALAAGSWDVPKAYWTVTDRDAVQRALNAAGRFPAGWRLPGHDEPTGVEPGDVTTALDVSAVLDAKRAALRAHATQVAVACDGDFYALSNGIAQPVLDAEHFILTRGTLGPVDENGREPDLLGGIE